jgi:hypothetical protein
MEALAAEANVMRMRAGLQMRSIRITSMLLALACQSPDGESAATPQQAPSVVEHGPPDSIPAPLSEYLADSSRSGRSPRVLAAWDQTRARFAVVAWHPHQAGYWEHRLSVLDVAEDAVVLRSRDIGVGDARWESVRVFTVGAEAFVVGSIEDEYAYGLRVLRVDSSGTLLDTRFPPVALPDTSGFSMGPGLSALADARVSSREGRLLVEFSKELLLDPGGREQAMLCPVDAGRSIGFAQSTEGWTTINGATRPAGVLDNALLTCAAQPVR